MAGETGLFVAGGWSFVQEPDEIGGYSVRYEVPLESAEGFDT